MADAAGASLTIASILPAFLPSLRSANAELGPGHNRFVMEIGGAFLASDLENCRGIRIR